MIPASPAVREGSADSFCRSVIDGCIPYSMELAIYRCSCAATGDGSDDISVARRRLRSMLGDCRCLWDDPCGDVRAHHRCLDIAWGEAGVEQMEDQGVAPSEEDA